MNLALYTYRTELRYHIEMFIMAALMLAVSGTVASFFTPEWPWAMLAFGQIAFIIGAVNIGYRMDNEKRERTARMLPLTPAVYGTIRFAVFVTFQLTITFILLTATLVRGGQWLPVLDLITWAGFNLLITSLIFINDDIFYIWGWWARVVLWVVIILMALISIFTLGGFTFSISPGKEKTAWDALLYNGIWLTLACLDVWIYSLRKSYTK